MQNANYGTNFPFGEFVPDLYADVAELADVPDLGSGVFDVQVQPLSSAPTKNTHLAVGIFCLNAV